MTQENKNFNYHIWTGPDLKAQVFAETQFPDGGVVRGVVGELNIKSGDAVYLDFGAIRMVYTRSGKGYESEFTYGRMSLQGCPVSIVLTKENSPYVQLIKGTEQEQKPVFEALVEKQKERIKPEIEELKDVFLFNELKRKNELKKSSEAQEIKRKEKLNGALEQLDAFFGTPKPKRP